MKPTPLIVHGALTDYDPQDISFMDTGDIMRMLRSADLYDEHLASALNWAYLIRTTRQVCQYRHISSLDYAITYRHLLAVIRLFRRIQTSGQDCLLVVRLRAYADLIAPFVFGDRMFTRRTLLSNRPMRRRRLSHGQPFRLKQYC